MKALLDKKKQQGRDNHDPSTQSQEPADETCYRTKQYIGKKHEDRQGNHWPDYTVITCSLQGL